MILMMGCDPGISLARTSYSIMDPAIIDPATIDPAGEVKRRPSRLRI